MAERLLKLEQVMALTSLSKTEIYRREKSGTFPARVQIGEKRSAWVGSEIDEWITQTINQTRGKQHGPRG